MITIPVKRMPVNCYHRFSIHGCSECDGEVTREENDSDATFWTVYGTRSEGAFDLEDALVDCCTRNDAEVVEQLLVAVTLI